MPNIAPVWVLVATLLATAAALAGAALVRRRSARTFSSLAADLNAAFRAERHPELAAHLIPHLPVGAADVRVIDVVERTTPAGRRAVGRVDYSLGSVGPHRNNTRLAAFEWTDDTSAPGVRLAELDGDQTSQYRALLAD